jgi:hypothetical protein
VEEGAQRVFNGAPFPASATAERGQLNSPASFAFGPKPFFTGISLPHMLEFGIITNESGRLMNIEQSPKKYRSNHSIVYSCQYHVIFCPTYRRKILHPPLDTRLKELILEKQKRYGYRVLGIEVMPDHVHLLSM